MASLCPICKKPVEAPELDRDEGDSSPFPFCSERCKLMDLGRWLDGKYQIPVRQDELDETDDHPGESAER